MLETMKTLATRHVKPRVNHTTWQRLRSLTDSSADRGETRRLGTMDLTALAEEFGTDKWGVHRYTPHYQRHLEHLRGEKFTLLEIGIGGYAREKDGGASLRMWKWFFPNAQVVGLDIEDKRFVDEERIKSYRGSQTDTAVLDRILKGQGIPLVVIDDGSHRPPHILETFHYLFPLLPDGAIYVIEDTQTSYWPEWLGSEDRDAKDTTMGLVKQLVDGLNYEEFVEEPYTPTYTDMNIVGVHCYHNLVFIEKGRNAEGTLKRAALPKRYPSS